MTAIRPLFVRWTWGLAHSRSYFVSFSVTIILSFKFFIDEITTYVISLRVVATNRGLPRGEVGREWEESRFTICLTTAGSHISLSHFYNSQMQSNMRPLRAIPCRCNFTPIHIPKDPTSRAHVSVRSSSVEQRALHTWAHSAFPRNEKYFVIDRADPAAAVSCERLKVAFLNSACMTWDSHPKISVLVTDIVKSLANGGRKTSQTTGTSHHQHQFQQKEFKPVRFAAS